MRRLHTLLYTTLLLLLLSSSKDLPAKDSNNNRHNSLKLETLPPLVVSQVNGNEQGVSAPFAAISGDALIVAGGCNFPNVAAADGGKKIYYNDIYALKNPLEKNARWKKVGQLPQPVAYGVTITTPDGMLLIGGENSDGSLSSIIKLNYNAKDESIVITNLPNLPHTFNNMCGSISGNSIYIAGGNVDGKPSNRVFLLNLDRTTLSKLSWQELPSYPGEPRLQPIGIVQNSAEESRFYLMGGYSPIGKDLIPTVHTDGYCYSPKENSWLPISPIQPHGYKDTLSLIGASAVVGGSNQIVIMGGVERETFKQALMRPLRIAGALNSGNDSLAAQLQKEAEEYLRHPAEWYKFNDKLLIYNTITDRWVFESGSPLMARAGAAFVPYKGKWLIVNGENKPGERATEVSVATFEATASFGWLNWTILSIYLFSMLLLGYYFMKRAGDSDDFFRGGGRIPWWAAGMSIYATMLSAITYMAIPAKSFATDWCYYPMQITILLVSFPVIKYYLPFFRRLNITSAYEYLQSRFNYATRLMASTLFIIFMTARSALVLYLPSLALTTVTGIDIYTCILLMGLVTIIYCTMGGMEAVVWGDVIQGFILVGGAIFAAIYLIFNTEGGVTGFVDIAISDEKFRIFDWSFDYTKATFWVVIIGGLANNLISYTSDQTVIQRYLTTKDERGAGRSILMNGIMSAIISIIFYTIGTGLYTFFKSNPTEMSYTLTNGDAILPFFMMSQLPAGVAGLLIAAIFAATMSTIGSNVNSTATAFSIDIYKKIHKGISDKGLLKTARLSSIIFGLIGTALALLMATWNIRSLFDYFNTILGLLSGGLGGLFIMGIFFDRINSTAALIGFVAGTATVIVLNIYSSVSFLVFGAMGIVVSVGVALLISIFYPNRKKEKGLTWREREK